MLKRLFRAFINLMVIAIIIGVIALLILNRSSEVVPDAESEILDETTITRGDLSVTISATGAVIPARQVALLFEASGAVAEILVAEGDRVAAGDVIARLDTTELESLIEEARLALDLQTISFEAITAAPRDVDLAAAEAALDTAEASAYAAYSGSSAETAAEIARLQAEIARNRLWQAQLQRDISVSAPSGFGLDVSGLLPDGSEVSQDIIDEINAALNGLFPSQPGISADSFNAGLNQASYGVDIADANYAAAASNPGDIAGIGQAQAAMVAAQVALDRLLNGASDTDLQIAEAGIAQARLAVAQVEAGLNRFVLTAPFDGVIAQLNLTVGELPPTQNAAALLVDDSASYIDLAIDETDVIDLVPDLPVVFRVDALPDTEITGTVTRVAVTPTIIGTLVTYPVRVALSATDAPIRFGMSATATIIVDSLADVLIVPNRFIRIDRTNGQSFVTIESTPGVFEEIPVELGLRSTTQSQIMSGVEEGQRIVLIPRAQFDFMDGPPR